MEQVKLGLQSVLPLFMVLLSWRHCIYNLVKYDCGVLKAFNPLHIYYFFKRNSAKAWYSLGGCLLCATVLNENYDNFGVFELYGDRTLADALGIALKMTLSIPLADILAYRKLTRAYFAFVEVLFNSHLLFVLSFDSRTFMHIVGSLELGLKGLDAGISSQCASAVDNLAAFCFNNITTGEVPTSPAAVNLARHIADP